MYTIFMGCCIECVFTCHANYLLGTKQVPAYQKLNHPHVLLYKLVLVIVLSLHLWVHVLNQGVLQCTGGGGVDISPCLAPMD